MVITNNSFILTLFVITGLQVPLNVTLKIASELGWRREEGQADGHELPAGTEAAEVQVVRGLPDQLDIQLVPQALYAPALGHYTKGNMAPVKARHLPITHVCLHQLEHVTCFFFDGTVTRDQHRLPDGSTAPRQHGGDGDASAQQASCVLVQVLGSPCFHIHINWGFAKGRIWVLVGGTRRRGMHLEGRQWGDRSGAVACYVTFGVFSVLGAEVRLAFGFQCSCLRDGRRKSVGRLDKCSQWRSPNQTALT